MCIYIQCFTQKGYRKMLKCGDGDESISWDCSCCGRKKTCLLPRKAISNGRWEPTPTPPPEKSPLFRKAPWNQSAIAPSHNLQRLPGKEPLSAGCSAGATGLLGGTVATKLQLVTKRQQIQEECPQSP